MLHQVELCPNDISISTVQEGLGYRETSRKQSLLHPILPVHLQVKSDSCYEQTWDIKDFRGEHQQHQQQSQDVWEDDCCQTDVIRLWCLCGGLWNTVTHIAAHQSQTCWPMTTWNKGMSFKFSLKRVKWRCLDVMFSKMKNGDQEHSVVAFAAQTERDV